MDNNLKINDDQPVFPKVEEKKSVTPAGNNLITQHQIISGTIKPRHLVASATVANGDTFYSNGTSFVKLSPGSSYQEKRIVSGVPAWITFPQTGVAASRPSSGRFAGDQYFATDTFAF